MEHSLTEHRITDADNAPSPQFMTNSQGHLVPVAKVKDADKLENDIVLELYRKAEKLSHDIRNFKSRSFMDVGAFLDLVSEKYGLQKGGKKGNMTLLSYDGMTKIQIAIADHIAFGPQLSMAKSLIDECIKDWGKDSNDNIRALIEHAFQTDKNNRVNTQAILGLRRIRITDEKWQQAMEAIGDSLRVVSSKQYIRFYRRPSLEKDWESCVIDIAAV